MSAFNHNIKLIRSLAKKTQPAFAELIGTNPSNIKTWENTKSVPADIMIYNNIAALAGVSVNDLQAKHLTPMDITIKVDKVEAGKLNGQAVNINEYINDLKEDKKRAIQREDTIMTQLAINLSALTQILASLSRHDRAFHETILKSLSRLEGGKVDLIGEARSYEAVMQAQEFLAGSKNEADMPGK